MLEEEESQIVNLLPIFYFFIFLPISSFFVIGISWKIVLLFLDLVGTHGSIIPQMLKDLALFIISLMN